MIVIDKDLIEIKLMSENSTEVISVLGNDLFKKGLVLDTYTDAVIKREGVYPTGLLTKGGGVAIPHTDTKHVKKSAIAVGILEKPIMFKAMGGAGEDVMANMVFLLAIKDSKQQLALLQKIMVLLQDVELLSKINEANDLDTVLELLEFLKTE